MRRNPPARWVLPETVDPATRRCIQIDVPDDPAHIAAFRGALLSLASAYNWADDPAHTAKDVALVWREIIDSHQEWGCGLAIEFYQDNCGLYYREVGAETWIAIYDGLECMDSAPGHSLLQGLFDDFLSQAISDGTVSPGGQQSPGQSPEPGGCQTYHVALVANSKWKIPFPVSTGDTITITNAGGGATDGAFLWYCADGRSYVLKTCGNNNPYQPTDPLQAGNHMQLIGAYNTTTPVYFDPLTSSYSIPSGVSNEEAWIQVNDGVLPDNAGELTFDCTICIAGWVHVFDFTASDGGWVTYNGACGGNSGDWAEYVAGQGWRALPLPANGPYIRSPQVSTTITRVKEYLSAVNSSGTPTAWANIDGSEQVQIDGAYAVYEFVHTWLLVNQRLGVVHGDGSTCGGNPQYIVKIEVTGTGSDPF